MNWLLTTTYYMGQEDARRVSKDLADGSSDWEKQGMMKKMAQSIRHF